YLPRFDRSADDERETNIGQDLARRRFGEIDQRRNLHSIARDGYVDHAVDVDHLPGSLILLDDGAWRGCGGGLPGDCSQREAAAGKRLFDKVQRVTDERRNLNLDWG